MLSAVLAQLFVSLFYDLGWALLPFSLFLSLLKLWVGSLIWFTLCLTNRNTRTTEQWHATAVRAERAAGSMRKSSGNSLIDTAQVPES